MVGRPKPAALSVRIASSRERSDSEYSLYPASLTADGGSTPTSE